MVDADGGFELRGLVAGHYRLLATPGPTSLRYLAARQPDPVSGTPPLRVAADQTLEDVVIALPRAGAISGRIVNERGDPLGMSSVMVFESLPGRRQRLAQNATADLALRTDDTGTFRVFGLRPGSHYLLAQPMQRWRMSPFSVNDYAPTYYPGAQSIAEATAIRIDYGDEHTGIELVVGRSARTFTVRGVVLDVAGHAAPMVQLRVERNVVPSAVTPSGPTAPLMPAVTRPTDGEGAFTISSVPAGDTNLSAYRYGGGGAEFAWLPLTVTADISDLVVRLQQAVAITGRLTFDGVPPASQGKLHVRAISLRPIGSVNSTSVQPNQDGSFTLEHQFGPILVRTEGLQGWYLKFVRYGGRDITDVPTEFASGVADLEVTVTPKAASLTGTVRTPAGAPTDAEIVLFSENPAL